ncbi:unnamed protein product [Ilex paraguariensis]|uniref:SPARK domain-containing protein n=1 Tax=Ilex paraguariensis TaxID=185542 RepID=A0ABC8QYA9_9AQUA
MKARGEPFKVLSFVSCPLKLNEYPYQPTGDCIGDKKKIKVWDSFSTTLCCRNALAVLSQALALQARVGEGSNFIQENQWRNCNDLFPQQQSVSIQSCGFDHFFYGSSQCSSLSLSTINGIRGNASKQCAQFSSPSFDTACGNCVEAIKQERDDLLKNLKAKGNNTEKAICGVAVVISVAAAEHNDSFVIDDYYRNCVEAIKQERDDLLKNLKAKGNNTEKAICGVAVVISVAAAEHNDSFVIDDYYRCLHALDTLGMA